MRPCGFAGHTMSRQSPGAVAVDMNETGLVKLAAFAVASAAGGGAAARLPVSFLRGVSATAAAAAASRSAVLGFGGVGVLVSRLGGDFGACSRIASMDRISRSMW